MSNFKCQISSNKYFLLKIGNWKLEIRNFSSGFTITELLVVMGIMAMLFGIVTMSLLTIQNRSSLAAVVNTLISEVKQQQLKSMIGDTEGRTNADYYGVYFETEQYTLFHGNTYNAGDSANFEIELDGNTRFSEINFPAQSLIFDRVSGEILNFDPAFSSITVTNMTNKESRTIQFNQLGIITSTN